MNLESYPKRDETVIQQGMKWIGTALATEENYPNAYTNKNLKKNAEKNIPTPELVF